MGIFILLSTYMFGYYLHTCLTSLVAQTVKHLPTMQDTRVQSLGWKEGNGNPLQYSCLENHTDKGAW